MNLNSIPNLVKSYATGIQTLIETEQQKGKNYVPIAFDVESTDQMEDKIQEIGGVRGLEPWLEGQRAAQTDYKEGFNVTFEQIDYSREIPIGRYQQKFIMNDKGKIEYVAKKLARKSRISMQRRIFEIIPNGVVDGYNHGYSDGKRLFSINHPLSPYDSTSYSNIVTASTADPYAGLMSMFELMDKMPDDTGEDDLGLLEDGVTVVTGDFTHFMNLHRIVAPDQKLMAGTPNNDISLLNGSIKGFDSPINLYYVKYAKNATYPKMTIAFSSADKPFVVKEAIPFETDQYAEESTKTFYVRARAMFDRKVKSPRHVVANLFDGTTTVNW